MSWVTAVPRSNDVFDEDTDELSLQNKEWRFTMEKRAKDGFRDGIDAGKEASLQQGFNLGYREGTAKMKAIGQLKGIVSALQCWCQSQASVNSKPIAQLLQKVEKHEEGIFTAMCRAQHHTPSSVSELVGDLDDLGVDQGDGAGSDCCKNEDRMNKHCQNGQSECCGHEKLVNESSAGILSEKDESLEHLAQRSVELMTEMGLPEELRLHIQQLGHACVYHN